MDPVVEAKHALHLRADFFQQYCRKHKTVDGDKFWQYRSLTRLFYAEEFVDLVKRHCWAAEDNMDNHFAKIMARYHEDNAAFNEDMMHEERSEVLWSYIVAFDALFFFGALTGPRRHNNAERGMLLVGMNPKFGFRYEPGACEDSSTAAYWADVVGELRMFDESSASPGDHFSFEALLANGLHELCHAALDILVFDEQHDRHKHRVLRLDGHGEDFWDLNHFVNEVMCKIFPGQDYMERQRDKSLKMLQDTRDPDKIGKIVYGDSDETNP
ncbi:hypothetical protein SUNI508_11546 [Seiridium unicorne]|uniref:Uncharacterized protein n=1 Tax=Seiridium unicorne TaxID=138068 RepID=A0ABR2UHD6_9PEZI